jgi:hypothetical protein
MKTPRADRPIPLALTALVAFAAALAALAVANGHDGRAHGNPATHAPMTVTASSDATTEKAVERRHAGWRTPTASPPSRTASTAAPVGHRFATHRGRAASGR